MITLYLQMEYAMSLTYLFEHSRLLLVIASAILIFAFGITISNSRKRTTLSRRATIDTPIFPKGFTHSSNLAIVAKSSYHKVPLMNKSEHRLFYLLLNYLKSHNLDSHFLLFSQVAMGEFIKAEQDEAYAKINHKRVDFLITDKQSNPIAVIEYQGHAHYQHNAAERDAIKREACRKANIAFIEITPNYNQVELNIILKILQRFSK